jgi:hypothetical protein
MSGEREMLGEVIYVLGMSSYCLCELPRAPQNSQVETAKGWRQMIGELKRVQRVVSR